MQLLHNYICTASPTSNLSQFGDMVRLQSHPACRLEFVDLIVH
jgi:hypothetical protein